MSFKLSLLSLGLLLIALVATAQLALAKPPPFYDDNQSLEVDERPNSHHHHYHHRGHRYGHHGHHHHRHHHHHNPQQLHKCEDSDESDQPLGQPNYGGPGTVFDRQPNIGNNPQQRPGFGRGQPAFGSETGANPIQPRPQPGVPFNFEPFGNGGNPSQRGDGIYFDQSNGPIPPRPQPGVPFNFEPSGNAANPLQPRPGVAATGPKDFNSFGNPLQPRPEANNEDETSINFQQAVDPGNTMIGRNPSAESAYPIHRQHNTRLQPRPSDNSQFGLGGGENNRGEGLTQQEDKTFGNVFQPRPQQGASGNFLDTDAKQHKAVDDNISSIFSTKDFLSPTLSEGSEHHSDRNPKADAEGAQPDFITGRNLFDTMPQCREGTELRNGRCRQDA